MPRYSAPGFNARQLRFIDEYLIDFNATAAYLRAGYSPNGARVSASQLLARPNVSSEIASRQAKLAAKYEVTRERIVAELAKIGFANIGDFVKTTSSGDPFVDLSEADRDQFAALGEITVDDYTDGRGDDRRDVKRIKIKLLDKKGALVDLGKHLGMFDKSPTDPQDPEAPTEKVIIDGGLPGSE